VYHLELRQFPKRVHSFNLSGEAIGAIVLAWVQDRVVELGEQKWSPHTAEITILEGPQIPVAELSLARGWGTAEREGRDVTEQVLAEAREAIATGAAGAAAPPVASRAATVSDGARPEPDRNARVGDAQPVADPLGLGVQLASLLGADAARLLEAWRSVAARSSGLAPSETLALAERELAREESAGP
jgi:hypothetical protein